MSDAELQAYTLVSDATVRNWRRLGCSAEARLCSRANKELSGKIIIPGEYFSDTANIAFVENLSDRIRRAGYPICDALYALSINLLTKRKLIDKRHVRQTMQEYGRHAVIQELLAVDLPDNEKDILGIVYQSLLSEGEKNRTGTYYTTQSIAANMTESLDFSHGETFFDPCCGSGAFLTALSNATPDRIFGVDIDPVAVMLAKVNLLVRYPDDAFIPQIDCCDYLAAADRGRYDYIVTNPPWGVRGTTQFVSDGVSPKDSFSKFFEKAYGQLKENGLIRFLFPQSILYVKAHADIREYILNNGDLQQIYLYSDTFRGVTTKIVDIMHKKAARTPCVKIVANHTSVIAPKTAFAHADNYAFRILNEQDAEIIAKVRAAGKYTLADSLWALGIVTGDNKTKLIRQPQEGFEKIYTGKEIAPYRLKPARNYICYDKKRLQQTAKEEYYRAKEKLVYKFISDNLVFAYDDGGSLFLNSANILVPQIPDMSIKTVLGFLNSELYRYMYRVLFPGVKVLKGNLLALPFAAVTPAQDRSIAAHVQNILDGDDSSVASLQQAVYKLFGITDRQIRYIRERMGPSNK